jgi:hypothetical protein
MRFPAAKSLEVDTLLDIYEGIIDASDKVLKESQIAGRLPFPAVPDGLEGYLRWTEHNDPMPPDDMTEMPGLIIGKLFSYFQNWANCVSAEVTRAKCVLLVQTKQLSTVERGLKIYFREEAGKPAGSVMDYVGTDKRYVDVEASLLKVKVFYEIANDRYAQLKRVLNNISREQTRRKEELERTMHDENGGREPSGGGGRGGKGFGGRKAPRSFRE